MNELPLRPGLLGMFGFHESEDSLSARNSLRDLAEEYDIPLPSKESQQDIFDLQTGKRTDPELE